MEYRDVKCPICGGRIFLQKWWHKDMKEINFETREIKKVKNKSTKRSNYCAKCGFRLYGYDVTRLNKETKFLEAVD